MVVKVPKDDYIDRDWIINDNCMKVLDEKISSFKDFLSRRGIGHAKIFINKWFRVYLEEAAQKTFLGIRYGDHYGPPPGYELWAEELLPTFTKFNSNTGYAKGDMITMQAFSHFTWIQSNGEMVICDLQGHHEEGLYILTDPAISSLNRGYGSTDLGALGILKFMYHHKCNEICSKFYFPRNTAIIYDTFKTHLELAGYRIGSTFNFEIPLSTGDLNKVLDLYVKYVKSEIIVNDLFQ